MASLDTRVHIACTLACCLSASCLARGNVGSTRLTRSLSQDTRNDRDIWVHDRDPNRDRDCNVRLEMRGRRPRPWRKLQALHRARPITQGRGVSGDSHTSSTEAATSGQE